MSMDDLAAEGLLLIRMQPDQQGRYGFIVKVANWTVLSVVGFFLGENFFMVLLNSSICCYIKSLVAM